jgi:ABC-2 type transport system ATP-binding protein
MAELRTDGTTILMSTHQMHQVEELCDRLVLIDNGTNVLYGKLSDIRRKNATGEVVIRVLGEIPAIPGVAGISPENGGEYRLHLEPGVSPDKILHRLVEAQVAVEKFEIAMPNLHEIFIKTVSIAPSRGSKNELTK